MRKQIIDKVKLWYWKFTHKFEIDIPKNIDKSLTLDDKIDNYWEVKSYKTMRTVEIAYELYIHSTHGQIDPETVNRDRKQFLVGCHKITLLLIFDIKTSFIKRILLLMVLKLNHPNHSLSLLLFSEILNLSLSFQLLCSISGVYLNVTYGTKVWFEARPECGTNRCKIMAVTCSLCGLEGFGKAWRLLFAVSLK